jgi:hypothetical protein
MLMKIALGVELTSFKIRAVARTKFTTAAFAPSYSGYLDAGKYPAGRRLLCTYVSWGTMAAALAVATILPPGSLFFRMKCMAS